MSVKRLIFSLSLVTDGRIPWGLRRQVFRTHVGKSGILGATSIGRRNIYIDFGAIAEASTETGMTFRAMLMRTLDHEYAHAFAPPGDTSSSEEELAYMFEQAGAQARQ